MILLTSFVTALLAAPEGAFAQFEMSFSYYNDIAWDGTTVYGFSSGYDGSWGCTHGGYYSYGWLSGPSHGTSGEGWGMESSLNLAFNGDDGGWTVEISTVLECSCAGTIGAGDGRQVQLVRVPTSLATFSDSFLNPPPSGQLYNRERHYQVNDQFGQPLQRAMAVTEQYSSPNGNCTVVDVGIAQAQTNGQGQFKDNYFLADSPPNPCQTTATQTIRADGSQVAQFTVVWTYSTVSVN